MALAIAEQTGFGRRARAAARFMDSRPDMPIRDAAAMASADPKSQSCA
jgi:hypothetical protein